MKGCDSDSPERLNSIDDLYELIEKLGFIPLFANAIPGFSVEEKTTADQWWTGDTKTDPWEWRQIAASHPDIAYGKFFDKKAGFISKAWFPAFSNYRRDGYDFEALFEDEKASYRAKKIMDIFDLDDSSIGKELMSYEIKESYGDKNFDGTLTDLQMQTYLIMSDFRQKKNKKGQPYGWHIAAIETPETKWGYDHVSLCYNEDPSASWKRIVSRMKECLPDADENAIITMLGIKRAGEKNTKTNKRSQTTASPKKDPKPYELPWPQNLITEMGIESVLGTDSYSPLSDDQMEGLLYVMSNLRDREEALIIKRYKEHMTLDECGDSIGRSRERVRQIIKTGIRKLRHPTRTVYIRKGYYGLLKEQEQQRIEVEKQKKLSEEKYHELLSNIRISECGLSVRTANCLTRAGLYNLYDVLKLIDDRYEDFVKIRNLGVRCQYEVISKLEEYGVTIKENIASL